MSVRPYIVAASGANYGSLLEACRRVGVNADVGDDPARIHNATHVILSGVGAATPAMRALRARGLDRVLREVTQPLLGICLGMQLLFESSEESLAARFPEVTWGSGLGYTAGAANVRNAGGQPDSALTTTASARIGKVTQAGGPARSPPPSFPTQSGKRATSCLCLLPGQILRLPAAPSWPHMGWNRTTLDQPAHPLLAGIDAADWFYFAHGYAAPVGVQTIAYSEHGQPFAAIVACGNVYGVQFHPEKSAAAGRRLLTNFFALT